MRAAKKIQYLEKVNEEKLDYLLERTDNIVGTTEKGEFRSKDSVIKALQKYKEIPIDSKGFRKITYIQPTDGCRFYCLEGAGLQSFPKEIRKFLSDDMFMDLDFKKCHPTILRFLMEQHNEYIPNALHEFIDNNEKFCKENNITKEDFLKVINRVDYNGNNPGIRKLHEAIYSQDRLLDKLRKKDTSFYKKIEKKKQGTEDAWNIKGSFISHCMQRIERMLLSTFENFLNDNKIQINVSVFDGCMILNNDKVTEEFLEQASQYILEKTKIDMKIVKKSMECEFDFTQWQKNQDDDDEYNEEIEDDLIDKEGNIVFSLEKNKRLYDNCKIETDKGFRIDTNAVNVLHQYLNNFICLINGSPIAYGYRLNTGLKYEMVNSNLIKEVIRYGFAINSKSEALQVLDWKNNTLRKEYSKFVFKVDEKTLGDTEYNLYIRPKYTEIPNIDKLTLKDISPLLDEFLLNVICGHEAEHQNKMYNYNINYVAKMVQEGKTGQCLVLKGLKGIGKSTWILILSFIIGISYHKSISNIDNLTNHFNAHLEQCILASVEEVPTGAGEYHKVQNMIKNIITEKGITITKKGYDSHSTEAYINFIICTNGDNPIAITGDNRRFLVTEVSPCRQNDTAYFNALIKEVKENLLKIRYYFYTYKYTKDLNKIRPTTQAELELFEINKSSVNLFFEDFELCPEYNDNLNAKGKKVVNELREYQYIYDEYKNYCIKNNYKPLQGKYFNASLKQLGFHTDRYTNSDGKKNTYIYGTLKN